MEEQKLNEEQDQALRKTDVMRSLSNEQIEMIADMFANREQMVIDESLGAEWILSHAFQLGAKFYRDFTNCTQRQSIKAGGD